MELNKSEVERSLTKKGFSVQETNHRCFVYKTLLGENTVIRTKMSHGSKKSIDDSLIKVMGKQCHLPKQEFVNFVKCSLDRAEYEEILKTDGVI
jgi:predicted transcriptional regulator